jgi:molybdenum cofactor sulfurtransferase
MKEVGSGSYEEFRRKWPSFESTRKLDELREREFSRLDETGQVYLDYTGGGLYAASQVRRHVDLLLSGVLGNPHSASPSSRLATRHVETARRRVLEFFHASPDEYEVVFTSNASQALKLVGESYPFTGENRFLLTFDNHNSVNGIREFARARGAGIRYVPVLPPEMRVERSALEAGLFSGAPGAKGLFAYPAQSNFSGVQHPLEFVATARQAGWDVLLDVAAFVPTNRLDLATCQPDFLVVSFYKMFGYPTGIGALIGRHEALARLQRPWFAGGTITVASVGADRHYLATGPAAFEDGTVNYASLPGVGIGLDLLDEVGLETIHERVGCLAGWLISRLREMKHPNGRPLVTIYGPDNMLARGGTVTMNLRDGEGNVIDHALIDERAGACGISLRTGCFCNPGAGELAMGITADEMSSCFVRSPGRMSYDEFRRCIDGKSTGAVRVSLGIASTFADVEAFVSFARQFAL